MSQHKLGQHCFVRDDHSLGEVGVGEVDVRELGAAEGLDGCGEDVLGAMGGTDAAGVLFDDGDKVGRALLVPRYDLLLCLERLEMVEDIDAHLDEQQHGIVLVLSSSCGALGPLAEAAHEVKHSAGALVGGVDGDGAQQGAGAGRDELCVCLLLVRA